MEKTTSQKFYETAIRSLCNIATARQIPEGEILSEEKAKRLLIHMAKALAAFGEFVAAAADSNAVTQQKFLQKLEAKDWSTLEARS